MNRTSLIAVLAVALLAAAGFFLYRASLPTTGGAPGGPSEPSKVTAVRAVEYYTCPMHPSVRSDRPGACPICGMTLVKRSEAPAPSDDAAALLGPVKLSPSQQVLANVSVLAARRARLRKQIGAVGSITEAEPNLSHITMRYPGRIERLFLNFTGERVSKGGAVAEVYSPEAISAQKEYLLALASADATKDAYRDIAEGSATLLAQSKQKLQRWGFTEGQFALLTERREPIDTLTIYSPVAGTVLKKYAEAQQYLAAGTALFDVADLSSVWLMAEIHEVDLPWVRTGLPAEASADAVPDRHFRGTVAFVSPVLDAGTRTAQARIVLPNQDGALKIGMFLRVAISVELPSSVVVPSSALITTGTGAVVWVRKESGVFEPRRVTPGARAGDEVQILRGLNEGDEVVVSGGYLLDSESQLQSSIATPAGE